jgi:triacylglycerol esterase/lipase EstA (alpha/beta hydrolase family)
MLLTIADKVRAAALSGGLRVIEEILGSAPQLGTKLPAPATGADPVILVGGWMNGDHSWDAWVRSLARDGIRPYLVTVPENATGDIDAAAQYVAREVEKVRAATGARKVDVIGYSMGGLISRQYAKFHAARDAIDAVVTLATPNNGLGPTIPTTIARVFGAVNRIWAGQAAKQAMRGSAFLERLNDPSVADAAGPGVRYGSVFAKHTDLAVTSAAARLSGATNVAIEGRNLLGLPLGPDHYTILHRSGAAYDAVRAILLGR